MRMLSNAVEVTPDSQGRILIPSRLQEAAGLEDQVLMVGLMDQVVLFNPTDYEGEVDQQEETHARYAPQIFR
jgi:DNA-binding transcriptional regulator/RsmH inhibitor MraZ